MAGAAVYTSYTASEFALKMDAFINYCESDGIGATDYQLINFFKISPAVLKKYRLADNTDGTVKAGISTALKKLDFYREDATIRQIVAEPKLTSHGAFKLRQEHWGGWGDKQEAGQGFNIRVRVGDGSSELLD